MRTGAYTLPGPKPALVTGNGWRCTYGAFQLLILFFIRRSLKAPNVFKRKRIISLNTIKQVVRSVGNSEHEESRRPSNQQTERLVRG